MNSKSHSEIIDSFEEQINIYFVKTEESNELMVKAFESLDSDIFGFGRFNHQWIECKQLMASDILPKNNQLFVIQSFKGMVFDFLVKNHTKIIGPSIILYYKQDFNYLFKYCLAIIKSKCYRKISRCLNGSVICLSFKDEKIKINLKNKIQLMSAKYSSAISSEVSFELFRNY